MTEIGLAGELEARIRLAQRLRERLDEERLALPRVDAGEHADDERSFRQWSIPIEDEARGARDDGDDGVGAKIRQRGVECRLRVGHHPVHARKHDPPHDLETHTPECIGVRHVAQMRDERNTRCSRRERAVRPRISSCWRRPGQRGETRDAGGSPPPAPGGEAPHRRPGAPCRNSRPPAGAAPAMRMGTSAGTWLSHVEAPMGGTSTAGLQPRSRSQHPHQRELGTPRSAGVTEMDDLRTGVACSVTHRGSSCEKRPPGGSPGSRMLRDRHRRRDAASRTAHERAAREEEPLR